MYCKIFQLTKLIQLFGATFLHNLHGIETQAEIKLGEILLQMDKNTGAKGIGKSAIIDIDSTINVSRGNLKGIYSR